MKINLYNVKNKNDNFDKETAAFGYHINCY